RAALDTNRKPRSAARSSACSAPRRAIIAAARTARGTAGRDCSHAHPVPPRGRERSNRIISHRRAVLLLSYKSALDQRVAETVGLFPLQEPIDLGGTYPWAGPYQLERLFQVAALAALFR